MAGASLSESRTSDLVGVSQQTRGAWVKRGLLEARPSGCTLLDALELAALAALAAQLAPSEVNVGWPQLRAVMGRELPGIRFDVVFDRQLGAIEVARSAEDLRDLVVLGRPVIVTPLGPRLVEIAEAFRR